MVNYIHNPDKHIKVFSFPEAKNVIVSGDIHGDFNLLVFKLCVQFALTDTLLIVAGDCGFGFEKRLYYDNIYMKNRERLTKANNWIIMLRGNHDNPAYFENEWIQYDRFRTIPDYSLVQACGHSIFCQGGAVSIDRSHRIAQKSELRNKKYEVGEADIYWPNEMPYYDEHLFDEIKQAGNVDTVISHTAPSFCEMVSKDGLTGWACYDETLLEDVEKERDTMDATFHRLIQDGHPLTNWYYGHFHRHWFATIEDVDFRMLDIVEFQELR